MDNLKDQFFNEEYFTALARSVHKVYPTLDMSQFGIDLRSNYQDLELLERLKQTSQVLTDHLPSDFEESIDILHQVDDEIKKDFSGIVFCDFVSRNGLDHFELSMQALEAFTQFSTGEFAIRHFLRQDFNRTLDQMIDWSTHSNHHVRRLSSEGSRPRLPWSFKLDQVISNPALTIPILHNLRSDSHLYVKKSVGNHLNDISKDNPEMALEEVKSWDMENENTSWIIKRGIRSLVKAGHPSTFSLLGFTEKPQLQISPLSLNENVIRIGESITFTCDITSLSVEPQRINIDYIVHYKKKTGTSKKVFKLKELDLAPGSTYIVDKSQAFKTLSTRTLFEGSHAIELYINGKVVASASFELHR